MTKQWKQLGLCVIATLALLTSALPMSVFAADCEHQNQGGVCALCNKTIVASVGETLFVDLKDAVAEAEQSADKTVTLLSGLSDVEQDMGEVQLLIPADSTLTLKNVKLTGKNPLQVVKVMGTLLLENAEVENTAGKYAVYAETAETDAEQQEKTPSPKPAVVTVKGGTVVGKEYGIGAKDAQLKLDEAQVGTEEEGTVAVLPQIRGDQFGFRLDNSAIQVLCPLGESHFTVESVTPGVVVSLVQPEEGEPFEGVKDWFVINNGVAVFHADAGTWELDHVIATAVTVTPETFTYDGNAHMPKFTVKLNDKELVKDEDYRVTVERDGKTVEQATDAGTYKVTVAGQKDYTGEYTFEFKINPIALTVNKVTVENRAFDGTKNVKVTGAELTGVLEKDQDAVSVSVAQAKGELEKAGVGTYNQVTVTGLALTGDGAKNYTLTQPTAPVNTEVAIRKVTLSGNLADITTTLPVDTKNFTVENLGKEMPENAGTLTYKNKTQSTANRNPSQKPSVIAFGWSVDTNGKLSAEIVNGAAGDQVIYEVVISSENYNDTVVKVIATLESKTIAASDIKVDCSATTLVYNGKAQKPVFEVKVGETTLKEGTDFDAKYPTDITKAGEKEVTVQLKGNYSGSTTFKYTIAKAKLTVSEVSAKDKTYDGNTKATVTAGKLTGAVSGDDVKVAATGTFTDKNSGTRTVNVSYTLSGNAAGNYELTSATGTTTARILPITASSISGKIAGLSTSNVNSGHKSALQSAIALANTALSDTGLSNTEKTQISDVKWSAEGLISRIDSAAAAKSTESVRATAKVTEKNVKLEDQPALTKANTDLNHALATYGGNYTAGEASELKKQQEQVSGALNVITRVRSAQSLISTLPNQVTEQTVIDTALQTSVKNAQEAFEKLNDYEKSLLGADEQKKLTTVAEVVTTATPTQTPDGTGNQTDNAAEEQKEESSGMAWLWGTVTVVALGAAATCAGLIWYKRKLEADAPNW